MLLTKLKVATVLIVVLTVLGATTTLIACRSLAGSLAPPNRPAKNAPVVNAVNAKNEEKPRADRARFRYGGKDFAYWREVLHNDLQPEMLNEALKALSAFAEHGYADEAIATILEVMRGPDSGPGDPSTGVVLGTAPATLAKMGPKVLPALAKEWDRGKTKERRFVADTLARMTTYPETVPLLIRVVKDKDKVVRRSALDGLAKVQPQSKEIKAALHGVLEDEEVVSNIAVALEALLSSGSPMPRRPGMSPMPRRSGMSPMSPHPGMSPMSDDRVANPEDVSTLITILKNTRSALVRLEIVNALGRIGPEAKDAVPTLQNLLNSKEPDSDSKVREAAAEALQLIQPKP